MVITALTGHICVWCCPACFCLCGPATMSIPPSRSIPNSEEWLDSLVADENKIKEKVLLYHEEYLKKGIEKLRYEEKKKALLIEK